MAWHIATDILGQTVAHPDVQVFLDRIDAMRIYLVHVRLARPREGNLARPCPTLVRAVFFLLSVRTTALFIAVLTAVVAVAC